MEQFSALLLSDDPGHLAITQRVLEEYSFTVKITGTTQAAEEAIRGYRFDLAVYDNDVAGAIRFASTCASPNVPKVAFGLLRSGANSDVQGVRVHFIVQKPFAADLFTRSLRAAFGLILKERRVSFRHPVQIAPASCMVKRDGATRELKSAMILDLSQTGMCLQANDMLTQGTVIQVSFQLPNTKRTLRLSGVSMWTRASGRTGIKFNDVDSDQQAALNEWLSSQSAHIPEPLSKPITTYVTR